jgi:ATP/maltotriose-dependent transcriptional regulator MalT
MSESVQVQVSIPLLVEPRAQRAFLIGREHPLISQEMELSRRFQRLFIGLDRQISTFSRWSARTGPVAADVAGAVRLIPRELAVLDLLAGGLTAAAIGRRLHIAERTVQKHLQHCYAKLRVADRLTAVQRAQRIGLLAPVGIQTGSS